MLYDFHSLTWRWEVIQLNHLLNTLIGRKIRSSPLLHTRHNHYLFPTYLDRTTHHVHSSRVHELLQLSLLRYESHWNAGKRLAAHYRTGNIIPDHIAAGRVRKPRKLHRPGQWYVWTP